MDPDALAISSHGLLKILVKFLDLASFRAGPTTGICSQHPGVFSIKTFCTDIFINLLLFIKSVPGCLKTKLKKSLPSTFNKAIGSKSEMLCSVGGLTFGYKLTSTLPLE